jgi:phenylpyruvate tautomerase PptA (4-oxalocrotonate tautomerase family)
MHKFPGLINAGELDQLLKWIYKNLNAEKSTTHIFIIESFNPSSWTSNFMHVQLIS